MSNPNSASRAGQPNANEASRRNTAPGAATTGPHGTPSNVLQRQNVASLHRLDTSARTSAASHRPFQHGTPPLSATRPARTNTAPPQAGPSSHRAAGAERSLPVRGSHSTTTSGHSKSTFDHEDRQLHDYYYGLVAQHAEYLKTHPEEKPRVVVYTDIEQDYDDLLTVIFLIEMHRLGIVELAGFIVNFHDQKRRARFLKMVLHHLRYPKIPVATGCDGRENKEEHQDEFFFGMKNKTFDEEYAYYYKNHQFEDGKTLLFNLANETGKVPLTVLNISSLQDIGEFLDGYSTTKGPQGQVKWNDAGVNWIQNNFAKFVSQGGYDVEVKTKKLPNNKTQTVTTVKPDMGMQNNKYHPTGTAKYCNALGALGLASDVWSREAAKHAPLKSTWIDKLFHLGPVGMHLGWQWKRVEFKFQWDPYNWPFHPRCDEGWYLNTRLGFPKDSPEYKARIGKSLPFKEAEPHINIIAYDCCAAVGAMGDHFMRRMGVLDPALVPDYNKAGHPHRVFGKRSDSLGGIKTARLAQVMQVFILGGLREASGWGKNGQKFAPLQFYPDQSRLRTVEAEDFIKNFLPHMKGIDDYEAAARAAAAAQDAKKAHAMKSRADAHRTELMKMLTERRIQLSSLPTKRDVPYENIYLALGA